MHIRDAQQIVDRLVWVKNGGRRWEWFVLSLLLFSTEGQKMNFKWEAELNGPSAMCAWWGVSDGEFIGQAWKISFHKGQIPHYQAIGKQAWNCKDFCYYLSFFSLFLYIRKRLKIYRFHVHMEIRLYYVSPLLPTVIIYLDVRKMWLQSSQQIYDSIASASTLSYARARSEWIRTQILKVNSCLLIGLILGKLYHLSFMVDHLWSREKNSTYLNDYYTD
jgi:hypothetical protein